MVGAQGQAKWAKVAKKSSTYDITHKKTALPRQKIFFRVQSTRLADLFELLNSSLAQSTEDLGRWQGNRKLLFFFAKIAKTTQTPKC